jgi:hypothetical protein
MGKFGQEVAQQADNRKTHFSFTTDYPNCPDLPRLSCASEEYLCLIWAFWEICGELGCASSLSDFRMI